MENASAASLEHFKRTEINQLVSRPQSVKSTDLAQSDIGFLFLLTMLLIGIGKALGSWILSEQVKIQKGPHQFVSRTEEYQNLHNQLGPNSFFRMF